MTLQKKSVIFLLFFLPIGGGEQFSAMKNTFSKTSRYVLTTSPVSYSHLGRKFLFIDHQSWKIAFSEELGWVSLNRTRYFLIYSFAPQDDPGSFKNWGFWFSTQANHLDTKFFSGGISILSKVGLSCNFRAKKGLWKVQLFGQLQDNENFMKSTFICLLPIEAGHIFETKQNLTSLSTVWERWQNFQNRQFSAEATIIFAPTVFFSSP